MYLFIYLYLKAEFLRSYHNVILKNPDDVTDKHRNSVNFDHERHWEGRLKLTHTHTHVGFYGLRGLSIGVMVVILYKLYVLLPYTYPTPKLSPHRRRCISTFPQKNSLCMIYKRFKLWGH